jgi:D-aspartate ligase
MNELGNSSSHFPPPVRRWLKRIRVSIPPAVVLGGSCNGLSFARSLGRRGVPVLMLETNPFLGIHTRYANVLLLPDVREDPAAWLQLLQSIGRRLDKPAILFSTSDGHTQLIARHSPSLESYFRFLLPDAATLDQIVNKRLQYGIAAREGIRIPAVHYPESVDEVRSVIPRLQFPALLKPYDSDASRGRLKRKLVVVASAEELIAAYERMKAMSVPVMIQELIPGEDSELYGYLGFWDRDGRERAWMTKRKWRQNPPGFGDGSLQTTVNAPEVAELSRRLLRAFGYRGFAGVEFKRDPRDGTFRLMELNARTESGNQLAISAGVDLPWIGYQYLTGGKLEPTPIGPSGRPVKYVNEEWDVQSFMALRSNSKLSLRSWLGSIRGTRAWAIGAWDDPLPLIVGLGRFLKHLVSVMMQKIFAR